MAGSAARLVWFAGAAIVLAVAVLWLGADTSPTTPTTRRLFGLWRVRSVAAALLLLGVALGLLLLARGRSLLLGYVSVLLAVSGSYAALDVAGWLGVVNWPRLLSPQADQLGTLGTRREPHLDVVGSTYQDIAKGWGIPSAPMPFRYRTDRYGLRNFPDRAEADIYLLGDSMLVGALVAQDETASARLESRLSRPVMQAALIGLSPQAEQALFRETGLPVGGKRILQFIFEGNDLLDSRTWSAARGVGSEELPPRGSLSTILWQGATRLTEPTVGIAGRRRCDVAGRPYLFGWVRNSFEGVESEKEAITQSLERFAAEVRAAGGYFGVVFVPTKLRVLGPQCQWPANSELRDVDRHLGPLRAHMQAWSRGSGIPLLDLTAPLQEAARTGRVPWFEADTHWNEVGHDVVAASLAGWSFLTD